MQARLFYNDTGKEQLLDLCDQLEQVLWTQDGEDLLDPYDKLELEYNRKKVKRWIGLLTCLVNGYVDDDQDDVYFPVTGRQEIE